MEVRIATLNIFFFPEGFVSNKRTNADLEMIRDVIRRLDSDIIVFQEINDLEKLEQLMVNVIPGRTYSLRDQAGHWAASNIGPDMKIPLAFDSNKLELLEVGSARNADDPPASKSMRDSVAARFRPRGGVTSFTVVGVHLKSGILTVAPDKNTNDEKREVQMRNLTKWITKLVSITPGGPTRPAHEPTVLIGDFNALRGNVALMPLSQGGDLATWSWPVPRFASAMLPAPVEVNLPQWERWTTHLDRKIIDHVIVSPEVKLIDGPWAYAFDYDESWLQAAGVTKQWLEDMGYTFHPVNESPKVMENLHHITDHRPVRVSIEVD